ncbi:hypothetical protein PGQ11_015384 [Apiospora arundinis]|uniref:Uncharacterized protein n=1 Tax=Apiospora arundinis TaxID=335852 RepID=A0ABR2HLW9_9PEZI
MPGITKPLTKPQIKRLAHHLSPAAVKSMKIDLSLFDAENEECCTYPKRAMSRLSNQTNRATRQRKPTTNRGTQWYPYEQSYYIDGGGDDGIALARSDVPLPGDGGRRTKPRLERQEAFRGPSVGGFVSSDDVVESDADLYRLGLLYDDDEGNQGSGFSLDAIVHEEPLYVVRLSRRKQKRGSRNMRSPGTPLHIIYESLEDSLYSMGPLSPVDYLPGEEDGEDWSFVPLTVPNGRSAITGDTVSIDNFTTASDAWVVLEGA